MKRIKVIKSEEEFNDPQIIEALKSMGAELQNLVGQYVDQKDLEVTVYGKTFMHGYYIEAYYKGKESGGLLNVDDKKLEKLAQNNGMQVIEHSCDTIELG